MTIWTPLLLTFRIALCSTALAALVGLPLARRFSRRGNAFGESALLLPLVLPPTTLGYYLLLLLGRSTALGRFLERHGIPLVFDWKGAVVAAACVSFPLFFVTARTALAAVDPRWEEAARLLGASDAKVFARITLPTAARGLASAAILAFARSVGDFGATLLVAGNIRGAHPDAVDRDLRRVFRGRRPPCCGPRRRDDGPRVRGAPGRPPERSPPMGLISASVRVRRGEFTADLRVETDARALAIFGASGAGKTTFLEAIAGLVRPSEGRIEVGGSTLFDSSAGIDLPPRRRRVGYVRQVPDLFPAMTVGENLVFALSCRSSPAGNGVEEAFAALGIERLRKRRPRELSGGETRRVQIARALASSPGILLLDEPLANLDAPARREILPLFGKIPLLAGVPAVLVTHDVEEVFAFAEEVAVVENGRVVARGEPLATLSRPGTWAVARISGVENFLAATLRGAAPGGGTLVEWEGTTVRAPDVAGRPGDPVTLALFAEDVLVARGPVDGLSARNALPMRVESIEEAGDAVLLTLGDGARRLRSRITRDAVSALAIVPGAEVTAVFKSAALRALAAVK